MKVEAPVEMSNSVADEKLNVDAVYSKWRKGKGKILEGHAFNNDRLQNIYIINMVDSYKLSKLDDHFGEEVIDLDKEIFKGLSIFDIMDNELHRTLDEILCRFEVVDENYNVNLSEDGKDVEQVLLQCAEMEEKLWNSQVVHKGEAL
ncbi:hypothetical protein AgCh_032289 [Apium graveolens]